MKRTLQVLTSYATAHTLLPSQIQVRVDGLYGDAAVLSDVLSADLGLIGRSRDYTLLDRIEVQAVLARPPALVCTHPESGAARALYDCPDIPLREPGGPCVRLIVATHPATSPLHKIGKKRNGVIYELFVTRLPAPAFSAKDVLDLYLHRGSFETVLADEDVEQASDRWVSHTSCGQEFFQILAQWIWNLRLELGQRLSPVAMRTTEFASACQPSPAPGSEAASGSEPALGSEAASVLVYGPPQWARRSFTGGFPGSAFTPQPDGSLLCPANHSLFPQERRSERDGSLRVLYTARIGDCRDCLVRAQCQETLLTIKPRRVSAVFWPIPSNQVLTSPPMLESPEPPACCPVMWGDWPRCHLRRTWLKVVRSETVNVTMGAAPTQDWTAVTDEHMMTREQRAHWRLSWEQRFTRNARPDTAPSLIMTIHGLPASFARTYAFSLLATA